jgi:glycosyltransferase involved in cell wall biosynthesis
VGAVEYRPLSERLAERGLVKDDFILFAGRISPEKGLDTLLEAMRALPRTKKLVIAGGSSYTDGYIDRIRDVAWDEVVFLGRVDKTAMQELYSNCYAFVLPSALEGLSVALLEALSYGNCIVTTSIPENLEVVGSAGLTFEPGDAAGLRAVLRQVLEDQTLVERCRSEARQLASQRADWDDVARLTEAFYESLLDGR